MPSATYRLRAKVNNLGWGGTGYGSYWHAENFGCGIYNSNNFTWLQADENGYHLNQNNGGTGVQSSDYSSIYSPNTWAVREIDNISGMSAQWVTGETTITS